MMLKVLVAFVLCDVNAVLFEVKRRAMLEGFGALVGSDVVVQLQPCGDAYCVRYTLDDAVFEAVVDTGSPFLQASCSSAEWRKSPWAVCNRALDGALIAAADTVETFGASSGVVRWRGAHTLRIGDVNILSGDDERIIFGVPDGDLLRPPGGLFFGLIRDKQRAKIRPTLLSQLDSVRGYTLDLSTTPGTLILRRTPVILPVMMRYKQRGEHVLASYDLREYGAPARYVAARSTALRVDGRPLVTELPVVIIFDSGVTGAQVSAPLFQLMGGPFKALSVTFPEEQGGEFRLAARRKGNPRFLVTPVDLPWGEGKIHVIALGLAFLSGSSLHVDLQSPETFVLQTDPSSSETWDPPPVRGSSA